MRGVLLNVECFFYPSHLLSPPLFPPLGAWLRMLRFFDEVKRSAESSKVELKESEVILWQLEAIIG